MQIITIENVKDIDSLKLENNYHAEILTRQLQEKQEVEKFHPCKLSATIQEYDNGNSLEYSYLELNNNVRIKKDYKGVWQFNTEPVYIGSYQRSALIEAMPPLNKVKSLSTAKILANIEYAEKLLKLELELKNKNMTAYTESIEKIESLKAQGYKVTEGNSESCGWIECGAFMLRYNIDRQTGQADYQLRLAFLHGTLENFIKLCENQKNKNINL